MKSVQYTTRLTVHVDVFWVVTPCSVSEDLAAAIFTMQQGPSKHYMASQPEEVDLNAERRGNVLLFVVVV
jgi:hypothetical protein